MGKTLIIAEKPAVATAIRAMLEAKHSEKFVNRGEFSESEHYLLSSFFGHLLELCKPDDYGFKEWKAEDLPIIPKPMKLKYIGDKERRGKLLAKLAKDCSLLINAADGDREGEGIFRLWYEYEGMTLPVKRILPKALPVPDLAKAWAAIEPSSHYDSLAAAQRLRMEADWLIGMNGSRAYSVACKSKLTVGRVQTATLALIVKRDLDVANYQEAFFYSLAGQWHNLPFLYFDESGSKFEDATPLLKIKMECSDSEFAVKSFKALSKIQNPPPPFSLHELQKVANAKYGYSLDKTLDLAQSLYEKKLTTYPRTGSADIPPSDIDKYYAMIRKFAGQQEKDLLVPQGSPVECVKDSEEAHTAIIPTGEVSEGLSEDEKKLYLLILKRFIVAFLKPRTFTQYSIVISNGSHDFRCTANKTIDPGFTQIHSDKAEDGAESESEEKEIGAGLSAESLSEPKRFEGLDLMKKKRSKPTYYTPGTLVTAMMNVGRAMGNKDYKEILNEVKGLGTEATRQTVPVELERRGYIVKDGKYLKSTIKGRELIVLVKPEVKSPELTAEWESKLKAVEKGKYDERQFRWEIEAFTRQIVVVDSARTSEFCKAVDEAKRKCPKCSKPLRENSAGIFCNDECGFALFKSVGHKALSASIIDQLFDKGITGMIAGFKKNGGKDTFSARLKWEAPDYKATFAYEAETGYKCPCCASAIKAVGEKLKCTGCAFTVWETYSEKKLSKAQIETLLTEGRTRPIKGFVARKNGKEFEAILFVDKEKKCVAYQFPKALTAGQKGGNNA